LYFDVLLNEELLSDAGHSLSSTWN
jgi:hypothetical protein